jgi:hypothetical protein
MTDTTEAQTPEAEALEAEQKSEGGGLRKQLEAALAENRELKVEKRDDILSGLGLESNSGLGLALAEQFDKGELTLEQIASTATEKYGVIPPAATPAADPRVAQIAQGQQALDGVAQAAGSLAPPTQQDQLARAEAEGNTDATLAHKSAQLGEMLRRK